MKTFDERNLLPEILPDDPMHQAKRWFDITNSEKWQPNPNAMTLSLGQKIKLIPGHCDPTVNLHDWYVGVRENVVETMWPVAARGAAF